MVDALRRVWYDERRVLIETARILNPQFKSTILCVSGAQLEALRNLMEYLNRRTTFASEYFNRYYLSPTVDEWDSLLAIVADLEEKLMLIYVDDYVCVRDKKTQGTNAGTFTSGDWRTRDINDEQSDASGICSIASNQVTLEAGTYRCLATATAYRVNNHQIRLYNATDEGTVLVGTCEYANSTYHGSSRSSLAGLFTLDVSTVLEIQHRCETSKSVDGLGIRSNWEEEIYLVAQFWRMIG